MKCPRRCESPRHDEPGLTLRQARMTDRTTKADPAMRKFALALAIVAATTAATPAFAQRASLADRVAVLEQRASDNQANLDLLNQVNQLKSELQSLRAQVEELQQQHKQ